MTESQEHYRILIDAAEKAGIYNRHPYTRSQMSSQYFKDYIKPANDSYKQKND